MTDRQTNGQTELPLIDSTPERGRVKINVGLRDDLTLGQLVQTPADQLCQPIYVCFYFDCVEHSNSRANKETSIALFLSL